MDRIQFNPKSGCVQNPIMQKCLFVLVFTVFSGGRWIMGGGCPYMCVYIYIDIPYYTVVAAIFFSSILIYEIPERRGGGSRLRGAS